jgi:heat shock protein HslJ
MARLRRAALVFLAVVGAVALVALAGGCSDEQPTLEGTSWQLIAWAGADAGPDGLAITIEFENGVISGNSGVNTFSGPYEATTEGAFSVGELQSTAKAGSKQAMEAEAKFLGHLEEASAYVVTMNQVALTNDKDEKILIFTAYAD